jgi:HAD superfamily hydrolase (TIGR01509 family)
VKPRSPTKLSDLLQDVEAVFFDLFDTLVEFDPERLPQLEIHGRTIASTIPVLLEEVNAVRPSVTAEALHEAFHAVSSEMEMEKLESHIEIPARKRFRRILDRLDPSVARKHPRLARQLAVLHMQTVTMAVHPARQVDRVIRTVVASGRTIVLVSNLDHAPAARWVLERYGLARLFEKRVVSESVGVRKPHERIFREALTHAGVTPDRALHIGDDPVADIWGAGRLGIRTVWINRTDSPYPKDEYPPACTVARLADLMR